MLRLRSHLISYEGAYPWSQNIYEAVHPLGEPDECLLPNGRVIQRAKRCAIAYTRATVGVCGNASRAAELCPNTIPFSDDSLARALTYCAAC